ncbi:hypothetical protein QQF64_009064 [Cirrhinus molitorella]|uniref:Uncharacterized protein n=1 Tax=Cirrhinus molitorella TaxID=172907 RepID=A0ABR3M036_9TELE
MQDLQYHRGRDFTASREREQKLPGKALDSQKSSTAKMRAAVPQRHHRYCHQVPIRQAASLSCPSEQTGYMTRFRNSKPPDPHANAATPSLETASSRTLKPQKCALNVQSYSQTEVQLQQIAPIHLTIGPMGLVHPVYISPMDLYPLLIGKDLLDRFEPLMDFKRLKIWAQVREPLPFPTTNTSLKCSARITEVSCIRPPASR